MSPPTRISAEDLRSSFDRAFAEPPREEGHAECDLLAIRVAGDPYAIRLTEVAGLFAGRAITPIPTRAEGLLGVAGIRASLVPVYALRSFLGYPAEDAPRWMVVVAGKSALGVAFDDLDGHLRVPLESLASQDARPEKHLHETVRAPGGARPVIHLPSLAEAIERRARAARAKEG